MHTPKSTREFPQDVQDFLNTLLAKAAVRKAERLERESQKEGA